MQVTLQGNNEQNVDKEDNEENEGSAGGFLGLPESDTDLKVCLVSYIIIYIRILKSQVKNIYITSINKKLQTNFNTIDSTFRGSVPSSETRKLANTSS